MHTHSQITAKFTWSPKDYQEYCGLQSKLNLLSSGATFFFFALLGLGVSWTVIDTTRFSDTISIAIGICFFMWLVFVRPWQMKRRFRQMRLGEHENQLVISEDGIVYDAVVSKSQFDWAAFLAHSENDNQSVLWINRWQGICIPKRAFTNDTDLAAFSELVRIKTAGKTLP